MFKTALRFLRNDSARLDKHPTLYGVLFLLLLIIATPFILWNKCKLNKSDRKTGRS